jgi:tRNA-Thr(GGU) m(6)t(6)A37 methyltransferase TsaA
MSSDQPFHFTAIGRVSSPYKQKFAIPRQPNLVKEARGEIIFNPDYADPNALRALDEFSHLWLIFVFHAVMDKGWSATVQPPRLGGKENIGVFASRSMFRPNPIGLSVVENLGWQQKQDQIILSVGGLDLLDGTPILDIKPYLPYADSLPDARAGYATAAPGKTYRIDFSEDAQQQLDALQAEYPQLQAFITAVLKQDPRPAWRQKDLDDKRYGMSLYDLNIKWRLQDSNILVLSVEKEAPDAERS